MDLSQLAGNQPLKALLNRQTAARGLSHAYILAGPAGAGKHTLARLLAAAWVCESSGERPCFTCPHCRKAMRDIHPDIIRTGDDGKDVAVAQVRALRSDAYIRPNEAERKVYIIENAQTMNQSAQNAILKLLEEGPAYAAFLLLTDNAAALLPTVRSRCETLSLSPADDQAVEVADPQARDGALTLLRLLTEGNELSMLEFCVTLEKWDRDALEHLFNETVLLLRHALVCAAGAALDEPDPQRAEAARQAADKLSRRRLLTMTEKLNKLRSACSFNVGAGHLAGWLGAEAFG